MKQWNTITQGSKITLSKDTLLPSFNGELKLIPEGIYFITGFWVDMCGLSIESPQHENVYCIQSRSLPAFNEVE